VKVHRNAKTTHHTRALLVQRVRTLQWPVADAATAAGIATRTAYKWLARYREGGSDALREREAGRRMTFGMVPEGYDHAVGLVQVRALEPSFAVAEWGFALGSPFWGSGLFAASARTMLDFAFLHTALNRVEARACVGNDRGNGALRKMGAVQEGVLRDALQKDGKFFDQIMWSIIARDWFQAKAVWDGMIH
jgi:RimJ/RimL family protein N-acetyltransferase